MWTLTECFVKLLWDTDELSVRMTTMILSFAVLDQDMLIASPKALHLVGVLLPLFDHEDNGQGQLLSILLFCKLVTVLLEENKKALKTHMRCSLLLLFFYCHDENPRCRDMADDISPAIHSLANQTFYIVQAVEGAPSSILENLCYPCP
ncbi:hypothetical protein HGM15179_022096 [Zosterops borbonicus]|uniref:Uncharacterized protein n=1 Tax=Zosterops borbonicus TaxID=364589 RepID=A0A8K1D716_9PASS|nr:hypothetical protein HGM15179_022096 [Zosterops borbonicus]